MPVRNIAAQPGVVILLSKVRGITMTGCMAILHASLFANSDSKSERSSLLAPTCGGDTFDKELAKDRRFSSSGLNLAFEGLLLGAAFISE
jgi:hypothetical protein